MTSWQPDLLLIVLRCVTMSCHAAATTLQKAVQAQTAEAT